VESLATNVERLKAYKARLILFPRKAGQHKTLDSSKEEVQGHKDAKLVSSTRFGLPIVHADKAFKEISKDDMPEEIEGGAYRALREARAEKRYLGARQKRQREKADEEAAAKK